MLQQSALNQFSDAPQRDVRSIRNWHYNHGSAAILNEEQKYLEQDDLFCVLQKDKTPLRRMIDKSYRLRTMDLWRRPDTVPDYDTSHISYYSDKRIDHFASGVIIGIGTCLLIIPLWILQALDTLTIKLAVITVFIFVFLLILSISMASKPFEALAATAAYVLPSTLRLSQFVTDPLQISQLCRYSHGFHSVGLRLMVWQETEMISCCFLSTLRSECRAQSVWCSGDRCKRT